MTREADLGARPASTRARVRTLIDCRSTGPGLVRRLLEIPAEASLGGEAGQAGELWFVIDGAGTLDLAGHPAIELRPDRGVWVPAGSSYLVRAGQSGHLRADVVELPARDPADRDGRDGLDSRNGTCSQDGDGKTTTPADRPLVHDLRDCEIETTGDRRFRVLFGPGRGCSVATQFVGEIPPGRAPEHSHPYDEVVLIVRGEGIMHMGGAAQPVSPGSCAHLPPGLAHCLENAGAVTLVVLGVFHPADSPAAKLGSHS